MSDPFLALPGTKRKRPSRRDKPGRDESKTPKVPSRTKRRPQSDSPESGNDDKIGPAGIDSDSDVVNEQHAETDESDLEETPAERRLRLAKNYLQKVRQEASILP